MPFEFIEKALMVFGLHPDHYKTKWQKILRITSNIMVLFCVMLKVWNFWWEFDNDFDLEKYGTDLLYFSYMLGIYIQQILIFSNFDQISSLIKDMSGQLKVETEGATQIEKNFLKFVTVFFLVTAAPDVILGLEIIETRKQMMYIFESTNLLLYSIVTLVSFVTIVAADFWYACMMCCFMNLCLHIGSVYQRLHIMLKEIDSAKSPAQINEIIRNFVKAHIQVTENIKKLSKSFRWFLMTNLVFLVWAMALVFINCIRISRLDNIKDVVFLLFALFLFSFPCEIVESQVKYLELLNMSKLQGKL